ncbi:MAG: MATE family efflux transporter [Oscillospiraceae bacterium]|nr:MATE family efflux transporter [Oscillospiraceae bacterium]
MITDLTEGKPSSVLLKFSLPMLWSAVFQQLYNICDSIIAGKFAGEEALAAIGSSYPVTQIFMSFALGSSVGASVIISQLFGAKKNTQLKTAVSTCYISFSVLSIILTVCGIFFSSPMLSALGTPDNIFTGAAAYLKIYLGGMLFVFMYNACTAIFNALGDSKTPLYLLIASSVINVVLDLLFVAVYHWGVSGAAWATFISQAAASVTAFIILNKRLEKINTPNEPERFSWNTLYSIAQLAVPSILQHCFVSVGNLFIQSLVNSFGSTVVAGYSAAIKLNTFAVTAFHTLGNGISNFTAQNIGAGKYERVPQGFKAGCVIGIFVALPFTLTYIILGKPLLGLFTDDPMGGAVDVGMEFLSITSPMFFTICIKLAADAVQRGAGKMRYFMISTFTDLIIRVVLAYILVEKFGSQGIWMSWPFGWGTAMVLGLSFYFAGTWKKKNSGVLSE